MLVLTCSRGSRIFIGDNIEIKLTFAHRGKAKIGITAPPDIKVHREKIAPADHPLRTRNSVSKQKRANTVLAIS